jgi:hypothetical protein
VYAQWLSFVCGKNPDHHPLISESSHPSGRFRVERFRQVSLSSPEASFQPSQISSKICDDVLGIRRSGNSRSVTENGYAIMLPPVHPISTIARHGSSVVSSGTRHLRFVYCRSSGDQFTVANVSASARSASSYDRRYVGRSLSCS